MEKSEFLELMQLYGKLFYPLNKIQMGIWGRYFKENEAGQLQDAMETFYGSRTKDVSPTIAELKAIIQRLNEPEIDPKKQNSTMKMVQDTQDRLDNRSKTDEEVLASPDGALKAINQFWGKHGRPMASLNKLRKQEKGD